MCQRADGQVWKGVYHEQSYSNNPEYIANTDGPYCTVSAKLVGNHDSLVIVDMHYDHCSLINTSGQYGTGRPLHYIQVPNLTQMNSKPGVHTVNGTNCTNGSLIFNSAKASPGSTWSATITGTLGPTKLEMKRSYQESAGASAYSISGTWRLFAPSSPPVGLSTIQSRETGLCLAVPKEITSNGSYLQLQNCTGEQLWKFERGQIILANSAPPKCVDVLGGNASDGNQLAIWDCVGTPQQQWEVQSGTIISAFSFGFKCMDLRNGGVDGNVVQIWDCQKRAWNQQWVVTFNTSASALSTNSILV